ncbi:YycH family regulatory protein [Sporolactobacillus putidus]|uniref:Regulatory protein YycH domain-containing protein n=1 Tax=Sporolactobacillus putidus TaxID=492735 RepID=A0A917S5K9_9BACL|nr:two-component system activity regulator YycH [Sporolactobacillus putidus]GGL57614.1 hypothetical protein GCM10007968_22040 [Sporolactobacillus putidus]
MNHEAFKTILLSALVLASVAMTWNIWFYKTDYENYKGPSESVKPVAIAQSQSIPDVVRPSLVLQHVNNETFGQTDNTLVMNVYSLFQKAAFTNVSPAGIKSAPRRTGSVSYELIFPAPLTLDALQRVFHFDRLDPSLTTYTLVDRVEVYASSDDGRVVTAVFRSEQGKDAFYATAGHLTMNDLKNAVEKTELQPYGKQQLKNKTVYLPLGTTSISSIMTYYEELPIDEFIPVLFNDPDNVFYTRGKTIYSDGTRQLEKTGSILQYVNPGISGSAQGVFDPIIHSIDFINNFSGWTNNYTYDGLISPGKGQPAGAEFRIQVGNYMAYNTEYYPNTYLPTMELTWRNGELNTMNRTLLNLNLIDAQVSVTLDSGTDTLQKLRQASIPVKNIEDLSIGYRLNTPQGGRDHSLNLTPDWFYKMDNRWYSVTDATLPQHSLNQRGGTP